MSFLSKLDKMWGILIFSESLLSFKKKLLKEIGELKLKLLFKKGKEIKKSLSGKIDGFASNFKICALE